MKITQEGNASVGLNGRDAESAAGSFRITGKEQALLGMHQFALKKLSRKEISSVGKQVLCLQGNPCRLSGFSSGQLKGQ